MTDFKSTQRGVGLLEPLIAIAILSFGLLGLAKFQLAMVAQSIDSQARIMAAAAAEDLLTQFRVDVVNKDCYRIPAAGTCSSVYAGGQAAAWAASAAQGLPGFVSAGSDLTGNSFTVRLAWTSKATNDARTFTVMTDAR